jgi:hypothetical protein
MNTLALITNGEIKSLAMLFVGVVVCGCIILFILKKLEAPALAYTILYVLAGIILLLVALDFFFA